MNKNLFVRIVLFCAVLLAAFQAVSADPYTILINPDSKPFKYIDDDGEIEGIDPDILAETAKAGGFEYELKSVGFDELLSDVAECKADAAISAISVTGERAQNVLFSSIYLAGNQHIYVKPELADETSLDSELIGKVGVKASTTAETNVSKLAEKSGFMVLTYADYASVFSALESGEVDAVVADEYLAKPFADDYDVMVIGNPISAERYAIAVCVKQKELFDRINKGLEAIRGDGTLDQIILENLID